MKTIIREEDLKPVEMGAVVETGDHRDFVDQNNNHRVTVVRTDRGYVGFALSALLARPGYEHLTTQPRIDMVASLAADAPLPTYQAAYSRWLTWNRD